MSLKINTKKKKFEKIEQSLRDLLDCTKQYSMYLVGVSEREERKMKTGKKKDFLDDRTEHNDTQMDGMQNSLLLTALT